MSPPRGDIEARVLGDGTEDLKDDSSDSGGGPRSHVVLVAGLPRLPTPHPASLKGSSPASASPQRSGGGPERLPLLSRESTSVDFWWPSQRRGHRYAAWAVSTAFAVCALLAVAVLLAALPLAARIHASHRRERQRAPPSMMPSPQLGAARWGIAGLGRIGHDFAVALTAHGGDLRAVAAGSLPRTEERAAAFAADFSKNEMRQPRAYGSYEALAADSEVDVVYVAVTNQLHRDVAMLFVRAGKHVLVEKPTAVTAQDAVAMLAEARRHRRLFVTNFWNMAFPAVEWASEKLAARDVGPVVHVRGDMAFQAVYDLEDRFLNPRLGGGATLDMGCYLIQSFLHFATLQRITRAQADSLPTKGPSDAWYARHVEDLARPFEAQIDDNQTLRTLSDLGVRVVATGEVNAHRDALASLDAAKGERPVDVEAAFVVDFASARGVFGASFQRDSPFSLEVLGAHGSVALAAPANCPASARMTVLRDANAPNASKTPPAPCCGQPTVETDEADFPLPPFPAAFAPGNYPDGMGFAYMIHEVETCVADFDTAGCRELPLVPHWIQLATQQILDDVLRQVHAVAGA